MSFERRREKNENEEKMRHLWSKNWPTVSLFIPIFTLYLFLSFYKIKLYFIPYQMNKSNIFFFLPTIILIQLFPFGYLNIKISSFFKNLFIFLLKCFLIYLRKMRCYISFIIIQLLLFSLVFL